MPYAKLTFLWTRRILLCVFILCPFWLFAQTPSANFTANTTSGCSPLVVNFQDQSLGSPTSWSWNFGNGNTSTAQNPTASYFTPGTYTVTLTATNGNGSNTLTRTGYIVVNEAPTVNFQPSVTSGCFPLRVNFSDLSTAGPNNTNTSWQWDFGNGTTSTAQNPSITYTTAGTFTVTLRVTNDKGCSRVVSRNALINVTTGVTASFTHTQPTVCQPPATVRFTNTSTGPGTLTYQWFFGDGTGPVLATSPTHTYATTGNYTATLVAISSNGCQDTARNTPPIQIGGYATSFTAPASICANQPVSFTNTSAPTPVSVLWNFGDGNTSTERNPTHSYSTANAYTVTLTANYGNCSETFSSQIIVHALPVTAFNASPRISCIPPLAVTFQNQTPGAVAWEWSFGDSNISDQQNPVHTYTNYGNYDVQLITTNANGCRDTLQQNNYIRIQQPVIRIPSLPIAGCVPFTIRPVANITTLDAVTSYQWDFGDGSPIATTATPSHTYNSQGTYTVTLTITTSTGCTETLSIPSAVRVGTIPVPDFSVIPTVSCAFQPVQFTDLSVPADTWLWNFGDGTTSTEQNPTHSYEGTGFFNVSLTVTNNGCERTITRNNIIEILPPIARFSYAANCNNRREFTFTDQSIGPVTWSWDFGDGSPAVVSQNPTHVFPALGRYTVALTVTNGSCSHTVTQVINTIDQTPAFSANNTTICRGDSILFIPTGLTPSLTSTLTWDFGNGVRIRRNRDIEYIYPNSGTYTVTLIALDINGCRDTVIRRNYIRVNGPRANFRATNTNGCAGLTTTFIDNSTTDGVNALRSWTFDFGDGNVQTFTAPPFQHAYAQAGTFNVKMIVTDAAGCRDSITRNSVVTTTSPVPNFTSVDILTCPNGAVRFVNRTTPAGFASLWDFGNGVTSTATSPTYRYPVAGVYTVKLVITDNNGCRDSLVRPNYIAVREPQASFTVSDSIGSCMPLEVQFTNTSTHFRSVLWDFGPGRGTSTRPNPVHYYNTPGTFRVKLIITSLGGCQDSAFVNIHVEDTAGTRVNYTPISGCNPLTTNLTLTTPSTIESYFWDFGDGYTTTTTSPVATHIFESHGNFLPKVIMQDPSGCLIPVAGLDTVRVTGSNVNFGFTPALLCDSGRVVFTDSSTFSDPVRTYLWNFGDGGTSDQQHPVHTYTSPGNYDVSLTIQTVSNCTNSFTIPNAIKVVQSPIIEIGGDTATCIHETLLHTGVFLVADTSLVNWQWTFPNGNTAAVQNPPIQTYNTAGNFNVQATATNSSGCATTVQQPIIIHALPTVTMPGQITVQAGSTVLIPATYSSGVNNWAWTPVTGLSCTNCATPEAGPQFNTNYTVNFSDSNGCRNNASIDVRVVCLNGNLFMPNTFSPNGDGSNDVFYPRGTGLYLIKSLRIFNRWGELVFDKRDFPPNNAVYGWNGSYKNKPPVADVYVYQVEVQCSNGEMIRLDGNIALIQ